MNIALPSTLYSTWSVRLSTGLEVFEHNGADWANDLIQTGDNRKIVEVRLHCPDSTVGVLVIAPGQAAFQLKCAGAFSDGMHRRYAHIVGRVDNCETGECTALIWDSFFGFFEHHTNFNHFARWRPGIDDVGAISTQAQGIEVASL